MKIEIIQNGRVLRQYNHADRSYIEAPPTGDYAIRLTNTTNQRKLAVLSVDGINVVDGEQAGFDGPGYVLYAWQTIEVKGWLRTSNEVATFQFQPQDQSYSAQTGKGTSNTGVIGVAVFDEVPKPPRNPILRSTPMELYSYQDVSGAGSAMVGAAHAEDLGVPISCEASYSTCDSAPIGQEMERRLGGEKRYVKSLNPDLGTGYGQKATMYTTETTFDRVTTPSEVISLRYAVREKLIEWGVPVSHEPDPHAFPAEAKKVAAVPAPPGWRG